MPRFAALVVILCAVIALAIVLVPTTLPPSGPGGDQGTFDRKVRAYLMDHPEVIVESVQALQRRSSAARAAGQRAAIRATHAELHDGGILPVAGNPEGDVTVVEFFDYRCPFCKRSLRELQAMIEADDNVRVVFKEFPVLGPESVYASRAAVAASFQGKYLDFHDALMAFEGQLDAAAVMAVADKVGLDSERLRADMGRTEVTGAISASHALARRIGISATPTFVIGDSLVLGYVDAATLAAHVSRARKGD